MTTAAAATPDTLPVPGTSVRLHNRAITGLTALIASIEPDQWTLRTPCPDWDVRALVMHLITEARWAPALLAGLTIAEVGSSLDTPLDPIPSPLDRRPAGRTERGRRTPDRTDHRARQRR